MFDKIKGKVRAFKMRYFWPEALYRIRDGMEVQLGYYESRRDWKKEKGDMAEAEKMEIAVRVLNYWLKEVNNVLAGNMPGENKKGAK